MSGPSQRFDFATHKLWSKCTIGRDVYISDMVRVRGKLSLIEVCDGASVADFTVMLAEASMHIGKNVRIGYQCAVLAHADIRICADVKLGVGVKLLAGITGVSGWISKAIEIGTGSVISAGTIILPGTRLPAGTFTAPNEVHDGSAVCQSVRHGIALPA